MPGSPGMTVPPGATVSLDQVHAALDSNDNRASDLERGIFATLDASQERTHQLYLDLANKVAGALNLRLAKADQVVEPIAKKIYKALLRSIGNEFSFAAPYGAMYPSTEAAYAGLQTGDPFGAFGLPHPAQEQVPGANGSVPPTPVGIPVGLEPGGQPRILPVQVPVSGANGLPFAGGPGPGVFPVSPVVPPTSPPPTIQPAPLPGGGFVPVPPVPPPKPGGISPPGGPGPPGGELGPPVPSPVSGQPGGNGQCPPGYQMSAVSYQAGTVPCTDPAGCAPQVFTISGRKVLQNGGGICTQPVTGGWTGSYDPGAGQSDGQGGLSWAPWSILFPFPPSGVYSTVCVNGNCLGQPGTQLTLYIPQGWILAYDQATGKVVAVNYLHGGLEEMATEPCRPAASPPSTVPPGCVPIAKPGQCVPDQPAQCGPDKNPQLPQLNLGVDVICAHIDQVIASLVQTPTNFEDFFGMKKGQAPTGETWKEWTYALLGVENPFLPDLVGRLGKWLQSIQQKLANMISGGDQTLLQVSVTRAIILLIHHWTGSVPRQLLNDIDYVSNTVRQSRLPSTGAADRGWLASTVTDEEWECYAKANGDYVDPARNIRDAGRTRPSFHQANRLFNRNQIDADRYNKLSRADGVINDTDRDDLANVDNYWPAVSEIFRWQQEQLYDESVIARFGLDQGFDQAYQDNLQILTDGHQMDDVNARRHYMQMWKRPGYGEMVEATRRLRNDRVDADLVFSEDDLNVALKQEGYPDYWIKRLAKLREHKPTRRDVRSLYLSHLVDEQEVKRQWQDQGFSDDFADLQTNQLQIDRQQLDYRRNGYPSVPKLVSDYAASVITQNEFTELANLVAVYPGQVDEMTQAADFARTVATRKQAVSGVRRLFMQGLIGLSDAQARLVSTGIDQQQVIDLTQYWVHVQRSRPKQVAASTLCTWRKDGLIGAVEQAEALTRLGYSGTDVNFIVADCTAKMVQADEKAAAKAAAAAEKAATKAAKEQAKAGKGRGRSGAGSTTP